MRDAQDQPNQKVHEDGHPEIPAAGTGQKSLYSFEHVHIRLKEIHGDDPFHNLSRIILCAAQKVSEPHCANLSTTAMNLQKTFKLLRSYELCLYPKKPINSVFLEVPVRLTYHGSDFTCLKRCASAKWGPTWSNIRITSPFGRRGLAAIVSGNALFGYLRKAPIPFTISPLSVPHSDA